jgi:tetratricopeptide (TPR) repeat protein
MAAAFQHEGSFDKAVAAFQRLIDEDHVPDGVREESMYRLAETHFARERFAKAIELFEALLVEYPEGLFTREARKRRAWAYFSMGEYAKAVEAAKDWRDRYGDSFDYEMDYIHGASLVGVGFYAESLPFFERIAQHADVPEEYRRLARFQQVVALLNLKQFEECARRADAFVSDFPNSSDAATVTFMAGESLWNLEKYEEAVTHFRRALDSYTGDWEYLETAHLRLANALERLGRYGEAAASYRELSQKNDVSRRATFRFRAGDCERKAGNVEAAIRDFETVIADFPNAEEEVHAAMLHLGELYSEGGDYDRAEKMVRGLMQAPNVTNPSRLRFFLGYLCYQQERYEEAVTHLTEALSGGDAGVIAGTAKFYLGGSLLELGKTDEALGYFADVLELPLDERPPFPAALLFRLEELYYIRNRFDVSESICRWLVTWDSGSVVYRAGLRLSDILVAQNRLQEAAAVLRDVQEKVASGALAFDEDQKPPKEEALAVLAEIYLREGKHDEAVRAAETCLNQPNLGIDYLTRARWVMGEILYREKHPKQALPYAVKCFVLADDPVYTPRAMLLAINIFIALDNQRDALTTWRELLERYPAFAEEKRGSPQIRELLDANPDRQDNADDQQP